MTKVCLIVINNKLKCDKYSTCILKSFCIYIESYDLLLLDKNNQ